MNNPQLRTSLSALILLLVISACILPGGLSSAPTADPGLISTMVVETASAARTQTAAVPAELSQPETAATESPVPGMTGTDLEKASDGTTKYTDHGAGFEVAFPKGWLAVRPNTDEFNEALANANKNNERLYNLMTTGQTTYDAEFDRLYSYPLRPDLEKNSVFGFSYLAWDADDVTLLDNNTMGGYVRELESSGDFPGFRVDVSQLHENANHVSMIEIGGRRTMGDGAGGYVPFYMTVIYFKPTSDSLCRLLVAYLQDYQTPISQDVTSILESIKLVDQ